jgi:hypothetical protein
MSWQTEVPVDQLDPNEYYFLAKTWMFNERPQYCYYMRGLNGRASWGSKPGIAVHFRGDEKMKTLINQNQNQSFVALKIPEDYAKRWKARKPVIKRRP